MIELFSDSPDDTLAFGMRISHFLEAGSVAALYGTLGSGKTCFTKGIALALGITENLTSPTYTIINEYPIISGAKGAGILYHIDAYRLNNEKDFEDIGGPEIINSNGIAVIEWSEKIQKSIAMNAINVSFTITDSYSRSIKITGLKADEEQKF